MHASPSYVTITAMPPKQSTKTVVRHSSRQSSRATSGDRSGRSDYTRSDRSRSGERSGNRSDQSGHRSDRSGYRSDRSDPPMQHKPIVETHAGLEPNAALKTIKWFFALFSLVMAILFIFLVIMTVQTIIEFQGSTPHSGTPNILKCYYIILSIAIGGILLSFLGFFGSVSESRGLLLAYSIMTVLLLAGTIGVVFLGLLYSDYMNQQMEQTLSTYLQNEFHDEDESGTPGAPLNRGIGKVAKKWLEKHRCCYFGSDTGESGSSAVQFWQQSAWYQRQKAKYDDQNFPIAPSICCGGEACPHNVDMMGRLYSESCDGKLKSLSTKEGIILGAIGAAVIYSMVVNIIVSVILYRRIQVSEYVVYSYDMY